MSTDVKPHEGRCATCRAQRMVYPLDGRLGRSWICADCKLAARGLPVGATVEGITLDGETADAAVAAVRGAVDATLDNTAPLTAAAATNTPANPTRQAPSTREKRKVGEKRKAGRSLAGELSTEDVAPGMAMGSTTTKPKPVEPLIKREWTRAEILPEQLVPTAWIGVRPLVPMSVVMTVIGLTTTPSVFLSSGILPGLIAVAAAFWLGGALYWLGKGTYGALAIFLGVALVPAVVGFLHGVYWLTLAVAALTTGAVYAVRAELRRRRRIARALVLLNTGLGRAVEDALFPAETVMKPRWIVADPDSGLPVKWRRPKGLHDVGKNLLRLAHEAARYSGVQVSLTMTDKWVTITELPEGEVMEPLEPPVDPEEKRLATSLSAAVGGEVTITNLAYDQTTGNFERLEFTWPAERASRMTLRGVQNTVVRTAKSTLLGNRMIGNALDQLVEPDWDLPHNRGVIVPVPPMPGMIEHPPSEDPTIQRARFGQSRSGKTCVWDLNDPVAAHALIAGQTGKGKTTIMLSLASDLPLDADVYPIDPKSISLMGIEYLPQAHGREAASNPADIVETLEKVAGIMNRRVEGVRARLIKKSHLNHIVLIIDEGQTMVNRLNRYWRTQEAKDQYCLLHGLEKAPGGTEHPSVSLIAEILQLGREAKVHILLATQQPAAKWMGTDARDQFAVRIAQGNQTPQTSTMMFNSLIATHGLEDGPGRSWVQMGLGTLPVPAQIYYVPKLDPDDATAEDRALLLGLGIDLPPAKADADYLTEDELHAGALAPGQGRPPLHIVSEPGETSQSTVPAHGEDDLLPAEDRLAAVDLPVVELEEGVLILVDTAGGDQAPAMVEAVDTDDVDPDNVLVSWRIEETGEDGTLSLPADDTVSVVDAA